MSGKIGFGIIGCGNIAPFHAQAINRCKDAKLIAAADTSLHQAERFLETNPGIQIFTDYFKLLKMPEIDVVAVCTPSVTHCSIVIEAARAKKHIICEKPLGINLEKIDRMIEICQQNQVKLTTIAQRRTYEHFKKTHHAVHGGKLGKMVMGDCFMRYYRTPAYYKHALWRATWEHAGGGALMNQGLHGLDILLWIMGDVKSVIARSDHLAHDIEVDDTTAAILTFKSGAYGVLEVSTAANPGQLSRYVFNGDQGSIVLADTGFIHWSMSDKPEFRAKEAMQKAELEHTGDEDITICEGHLEQYTDFVAAINENRDPLVTPQESRNDIAVIQAIYESARLGREVSL